MVSKDVAKDVAKDVPIVIGKSNELWVGGQKYNTSPDLAP